MDADPVGGQGERGGSAGRAGADHQHIGVEVSHGAVQPFVKSVPGGLRVPGVLFRGWETVFRFREAGRDGAHRSARKASTSWLKLSRCSHCGQ